MQYIIRRKEENKRNKEAKNIFTDKKGKQWEYLTRKQFLKLPEQEQRISADMRKKDSGSANLLLRDGEVRCGLYQYKSKKRFSEKTIGYIPVLPVDNDGEVSGDPSCVRILGKSIVKAYIVPLLILCLIVGLLLGGLWYLRENKVPGLDESAIAYNVEGLENTDPTQILMPGFTGFTMEAGSTHIEHVLYNPEGNPCYFKYQIVMQDTQEVLYESGLIEPGTAIMEFDLNRTLEPGTYNVTVLALTTSIEDGESEMNRGAANTTITVE